MGKNIFTVGLIGCGRIGFKNDHKIRTKYPLTHFSAFYQNKNFKITAVAEPEEKIRKIIEKKYKIKTYENHQNLLKNEKCEVISIAAPTADHEKILLDAAAARPKLVFCEKPLTNNRKNFSKIIDAYRTNNISLSVNFTRRFLPEYALIKKTLDAGRLGKLSSITVNYSRGFIHNGSHYLDLFLWYFGEPKKATPDSSRPGLLENDPTFNLTLYYPGGLEVKFIGMETGNLIINELDFIGDRGRIKIDTDRVMSFYKPKARPNYPGFKFFTKSKEISINEGLALSNAVKEIFNHLEFHVPLISEGKNSIKIYKIINQVFQIYETRD